MNFYKWFNQYFVQPCYLLLVIIYITTESQSSQGTNKVLFTGEQPLQGTAGKSYLVNQH